MMFQYWLITFFLFVLLIALSIYDIKFYRIPDLGNVTLLVFGASYVYLYEYNEWHSALYGCLTAFAIFAIVRVGYYHIYGRQGIGLGDVKFATAAGVWTGLAGIPAFLFLASFSALSWIIVLAVVKRRPIKMIDRLPFGPFLALSLALTWHFKNQIPEIF